MLKVKTKCVHPLYIRHTNYMAGKKYAVVNEVTLDGVKYWINLVGAVKMEYEVHGYKFLVPTAALTTVKLEAGVAIRFYNAKGKCVAKWVSC